MFNPKHKSKSQAKSRASTAFPPLWDTKSISINPTYFHSKFSFLTNQSIRSTKNVFFVNTPIRLGE
ncbi:MAG: hypothetical protein PWP57_405 [Candidatus Atribacteria bacterium]|nr:hypothetical protein [Candidatus Atribacteria bacterium]